MSYASNLDREGIDSGYLLVLEPRRFVTVWEHVSGDTYKAAFDFGEVRSFRADDESFALVGSATPAPGEFYYDVDTEELYANFDGDDPDDLDCVAGYELYFATFDAHFNRSPLDPSSRVVYFEPMITSAPAIVADLRDSIFGYLPSSASSIGISNSERYLAAHAESSFNEAPLALYHYLKEIDEELETADLKRVYRGLIRSLSFTDDLVTIVVKDRNDIFATEYRHPGSDPSFFDSGFPSIDPDQRNRPIRKVFGAVEGVIGVNIAFSETLTPSVNHRFVLHSGTEPNAGSVTTAVAASPSSTTTRTYVDNVEGLRVGDDVAIDGSVFVNVSAVGPDYIEHDAIGSPASTGESVYRSYIGNVSVIADGRVWPLPGDAWAELATAGTLGVQIDQTEAMSLIGRYVSHNDTVYARFYGDKCAATLGGNPFGADSLETGNLTQGAVLLWNLFREVLGLAESELDVAAFQTLQAEAEDELGYCLPFRTGDNFPIMRDVITRFATSLILRTFLDDDGKWSVKQTKPLEAPTKAIDDTEIMFKRFVYSLSYDEVVSDVYVEYAGSEVNSRGALVSEGSFLRVRSTSETARRLHRVTRQKTYQSLHILEVDAQKLADRLSFYFGDRRGLLTIATKNRFFDSQIGDVISVSRDLMPGFPFAAGVERTKDLGAVATEKSLTEISITLDDQKGVEDNAGDW